ncbi:MAG: DUF1272 domain-containing protein [Bacteriovoracaceae bacterium]
MKNKCEKCLCGLSSSSDASICSFECTFCKSCTEALISICPNCDGELVARPRKTVSPPVVGITLISRKLFRGGIK